MHYINQQIGWWWCDFFLPFFSSSVVADEHENKLRHFKVFFFVCTALPYSFERISQIFFSSFSSNWSGLTWNRKEITNVDFQALSHFFRIFSSLSIVVLTICTQKPISPYLFCIIFIVLVILQKRQIVEFLSTISNC